MPSSAASPRRCAAARHRRHGWSARVGRGRSVIVVCVPGHRGISSAMLPDPLAGTERPAPGIRGEPVPDERGRAAGEPSATLARVTRPGDAGPRLVHHDRGARGSRQDDAGGGPRRRTSRAWASTSTHPRAGRHVARRAASRGPPGAHRLGRADRSADRRAAVQRRPPPARDRGHPPGARGGTDGRLRALRRLDAGLPGLRRRRSRSSACAPSRLAATDGLKPDLTILLDLPVEDGLARKAPGDVTRFEAEFDLAFHRRVRDGFLALAAAEPDRFAVVDARRPTADVARRGRRGRRPPRPVG